ncbi:MAG: hypothetical protein QM811_00970 [Pirellulales bacterium]
MGTPRKTKATKTTWIRMGEKVGGYVDLFFRTICVILGFMASDFVRFVDESPKPNEKAPAVQTADTVNLLLPPIHPAPVYNAAHVQQQTQSIVR